MLMAFLGQRRALIAELEHLQERKGAIALELQRPGANANALRLEAADVERKLSDANIAIRAVNRAISGGGGASEGGNGVGAGEAVIAGSETQPSLPAEAAAGLSGNAMYIAGGGLLLLVTLGIASFAMLAKRLRRHAAESAALLRSDLNDQIGKVASGFDAMAIEIERIGEGQRYVTKLLSEAPQGVELLQKAAEAEPVKRT